MDFLDLFLPFFLSGVESSEDFLFNSRLVSISSSGLSGVTNGGVCDAVGTGIEQRGFPETSVGVVGFREQARDDSSDSLAGVRRGGGFMTDLIEAMTPCEVISGESVGVGSEDWPRGEDQSDV